MTEKMMYVILTSLRTTPRTQKQTLNSYKIKTVQDMRQIFADSNQGTRLNLI